MLPAVPAREPQFQISVHTLEGRGGSRQSQQSLGTWSISHIPRLLDGIRNGAVPSLVWDRRHTVLEFRYAPVNQLLLPQLEGSGRMIMFRGAPSPDLVLHVDETAAPDELSVINFPKKLLLYNRDRNQYIRLDDDQRILTMLWKAYQEHESEAQARIQRRVEAHQVVEALPKDLVREVSSFLPYVRRDYTNRRQSRPSGFFLPWA